MGVKQIKHHIQSLDSSLITHSCLFTTGQELDKNRVRVGLGELLKGLDHNLIKPGRVGFSKAFISLLDGK